MTDEKRRPPRLARRIVIALAAEIAIGAGFVGYVAYDGHRELQRELELLRASGAPEFPEQFEFPAVPPGEDMLVWSREILATSDDWIGEAPAPCAEARAANTSADELATLCDAALRDPRRALALTDCERAVLEARWQADRKALEVAARVDGVAPLDWARLWRFEEQNLDTLMSQTPPAGDIVAVRILGRDAIRHALRGDPTGTVLRLRQAWSVLDRLGTPRDVGGFEHWGISLLEWMQDGFLPALQILGAGAGLEDFQETMRGVDVAARFQTALIGERASTNRIYRFIREGGAPRLERQWNWSVDGLALSLWRDRDQASMLTFFREAIAGCEARIHGEHVPALDPAGVQAFVERPRWLRRPTPVVLIGGYMSWTLEFALQLESRMLLTQAALIARRDGAIAAQSWLAGRRDPFGEGALGASLEHDGILRMWSVGPDGPVDPIDMPKFKLDQEYRPRIELLVRPRGP